MTTVVLVFVMIGHLAGVAGNQPTGNVGPLALPLEISGTVEVRPSGGTEWLALKADGWLYEGDIVRAGKKGEAHLLLPSNDMVSLKDGEEYKVGGKEAPTGPSGTSYWARMMSLFGSDDISQLAAARSADESQGVVPLSPFNSRLLGPAFRLRWRGGAPDKEHHVSILDETGKEVWKTQTRNCAVEVPADKSPLQPGKAYSWVVTEGESASEDRMMVVPGPFRVLTESEARDVQAQAERELAVANVPASAAVSAKRALWYADHDFDVEAETWLEQAIRMAENDGPYKVLFDTFYLSRPALRVDFMMRTSEASESKALRFALNRMQSGDMLKVKAAATKPCHLYVVFIDSADTVNWLYPAAAGTGQTLNPGDKVELPVENRWFRLDNKTGQETLVVLATNEAVADREKLGAALLTCRRGEIIPQFLGKEVVEAHAVRIDHQ